MIFTCFLLCFAFPSFSQDSRKDIYELYLDSLYAKELKLCDSLIDIKLYGPAREVLRGGFLSGYFYYLKPEKRKIEYDNKLRLIDSLARTIKDPKDFYEQEYKEHSYRASLALKRGNFEEAIAQLSRVVVPQEKQEIAQKEIEKIKKGLRIDTISTIYGILPTQLTKEHVENKEDVLKIAGTKNNFDGTWIIRTYNGSQGFPHSYILKYNLYQNGLFIAETRSENYLLKTFYRNCAQLNLQPPLDKSNYYLYEENYKKNDTIYQINYYENGEIFELEKNVDFPNGSYYYLIQIHPNKITRSFAEGRSENGRSEGVSYELNEEGDTLQYQMGKTTEKGYYQYDLRLFEDKDTLELSERYDEKLEGLEIRPCNQWWQNKTSRLKLKWNNGVMLDVLNQDIIFTDASGNILSKKEFIDKYNKSDPKSTNAFQVTMDSPKTPEANKKYYILFHLYDRDTKMKDSKVILEKWLKMNKK